MTIIIIIILYYYDRYSPNFKNKDNYNNNKKYYFSFKFEKVLIVACEQLRFSSVSSVESQSLVCVEDSL